MKRSKRTKARTPVSHRAPAPIQAAELVADIPAYVAPEPEYRAYTPEPVPIESAKPWYQRLGF